MKLNAAYCCITLSKSRLVSSAIPVNGKKKKKKVKSRWGRESARTPGECVFISRSSSPVPPRGMDRTPCETQGLLLPIWGQELHRWHASVPYSVSPEGQTIQMSVDD